MIRKPKSHLSALEKRMVWLTVFLFLFASLVVYKLFVLQVVEGRQAKLLAEDQHSVFQRLFPARGEIKITDKFSSEGYPVATNIQKPLVYAVPGDIQDPNVVANALGTVLKLDPKDILAKIADKSRKYVPLKKQLTDEEVEQVKKLKLVGIQFDSEDMRYYPQGTLLSHVLGFVGYNKDDKRVGLYGLEKYFQNDLAGSNGYIHEEKDTAGAWIFGGKRDLVPAQDGVNLVLTIDKTLQLKAEQVLKETVSHHGADNGTVIIANPKTGAILAMANYPDFNVNEYNKIKSEDSWIYSNKATIGNYEPGSIFKPLTMAAAINEGKVTADTTFTDTGSVVVDGYTIKNSDDKAHGVQTMTQVLEESLNTGIIYAKEQIGNQEFYKYVRKFGFGSETGIELPEAQGNLDNLRGNILVNYDTASFGQGISVTPIQLIQSYTALANDGKMMRPYIVQSKVYADGKTEKTEPKVVDQVISKKTSAMISGMLVQVIENGHGKKAGVNGYWLAGKTGTAQVPRKDGKPGYEENNNIGSFIGYGPVEDPEFVMLVRVDHPRDVSFAESSAAPAWGELARFILSYYNIAPTRK